MIRTYRNAEDAVEETKAEKAEKSQEDAKKLRLNLELFREELKALGISVRLNVIKNEMQLDLDKDSRITGTEDLVTYLYSELGEKYYDAKRDTLKCYLSMIARQNQYNPVLDHLQTLTWDGLDHIEELCQLIGIASDDRLSRAILKNWLYQAVALLYNDIHNPFGAEGVLLLNGPQGCGKTSLLRKLGLKPQ